MGENFYRGLYFLKGKFFVDPRNFTEAAKFFRLAIDQGNVNAKDRLRYIKFELGHKYLRFGRDVPMDAIEAYKWFKLAAEQGNKDAVKELPSLASPLSPEELEEGERRYREFKASH